MIFNFFLIPSPLEQFEILPYISIYSGKIDLSITNETLILILLFFATSIIFNSCFRPAQGNSISSFYAIPHKIQALLEIIFKLIVSMIVENVGTKHGQAYFPLIFSIFFFFVNLNMIGLIPYSFTLTSHLIVTITLSLTFFIGLNIICIQTHGIKFFSLFFPQGTSFALGFLLVPIEIISYVFKPVSLSIRLFANMMAGHTLLKVIAGFGWTLMSCTGLLFLLHYVCLLILIPLFGLELGVALIQAFVFTVLTCIYLNDVLHLH
jgi:ATP synthase subunit 6